MSPTCIALPEFTGSYLSFDGQSLYLSQWYKHRILQLDPAGQVLRESLRIGAEICGHAFVEDHLYVLRGTEQDGENWHLARLDHRDGHSLTSRTWPGCRLPVAR